MTWQEELASLVGDTGIRYAADAAVAEEEERDAGDTGVRVLGKRYYRVYEEGAGPEESLKEQVTGFVVATGEMLRELGCGFWDVAQQSLEGVGETYVGKKVRGHWDAVLRRLEFMNEYLPEDRDPAHAWPIVITVFLLALLVLSVNNGNETSVEAPKKLYVSPPSASRIQLLDGRYMAYQEKGVLAERARFFMIAPHAFLSSRLAGIPGIKESLLEEFGVRLITYDLPGFGESDPHPVRNLNSSAMDMLHLANALGVTDEFWVVGYSGGAMHAWAAVHYLPDRLAGAAMFAPMSNPYDSSLNKEEIRKTWDEWTMKRRLMYVLARRFPSLLPYFYHRNFLSGERGQPEKWLSLSLGKKEMSHSTKSIYPDNLTCTTDSNTDEATPKITENIFTVSRHLKSCTRNDGKKRKNTADCMEPDADSFFLENSGNRQLVVVSSILYDFSHL
ncbi:hydrolase, alpha beta fold family protein [Musa troglodytarum]|uniref:Hydrolase, alpha beta fold family protein n=1 Tax=Musa troglodytarum TaxID=320322 RepID=A0A9E7KV85_9LILI|nr:hydrolase, alpha beta fold family protein [Musa troglodytarum]